MKTVKILDNDNFGNGIAKIDNKIIFVPLALKDEEIKIEITKQHKKYDEAKILSITKESDERIKPICPYFSKCGGCSFLHCNINYEEQIKTQYLKRLFPNTKINPITKTDTLNYRNKVTFHIKDGKLGFYKKNSNDLIEIDKCFLIDDKINNLLSILKKIPLVDGKIVIRCSYTTGEIMLITNFLKDASIIKDKVTSLYYNNKLIYGNPYIKEVINGLTYTIYPDSFYQVNTKGMIKLYDIIKKYAKEGNSFLDLYCGTGSIAIYLKDNFKDVYGIEIVEDAIKNANLNKELNKISNVFFEVNDAINMKDKYYDVISVDPPRSGLDKKVISKIKNLKPKRIVYTSCNPNTLKRDVEYFSDLYELKEISLVNLFPRTSHIETVVLLVLKCL